MEIQRWEGIQPKIYARWRKAPIREEKWKVQTVVRAYFQRSAAQPIP
jgi:hypothetical protein